VACYHDYHVTLLETDPAPHSIDDIVDPYREQATFPLSRSSYIQRIKPWSRFVKKRKAFLQKISLIEHKSISLQLVWAKNKTTAVEHHSAQKLYSFTIALLDIFDLFSLAARLLLFL